MALYRSVRPSLWITEQVFSAVIVTTIYFTKQLVHWNSHSQESDILQAYYEIPATFVGTVCTTLHL